MSTVFYGNGHSIGTLMNNGAYVVNEAYLDFNYVSYQVFYAKDQMDIESDNEYNRKNKTCCKSFLVKYELFLYNTTYWTLSFDHTVLIKYTE